MLAGSASPSTSGPMMTPPTIRKTTWGTRSRANSPTAIGASAATTTTTNRLLRPSDRSSATVSALPGPVGHDGSYPPGPQKSHDVLRSAPFLTGQLFQADRADQSSVADEIGP